MPTDTRQRPLLAAGTSPLDTTKRDLTLAYGGRTFAVRAYRDDSGPDGAGWHALILEHRTPLRHGLGPTADLADCFAEAVRFLTPLVEVASGAAGGAPLLSPMPSMMEATGVDGWEAEGGAIRRDRDRSAERAPRR
jgi:hypothetical protein